MCNNQFISIEEALNRAFWHIKAPSMTLFFIPLILYVTLAKVGYLPSIGYEGLKWAGPAFLLSFIGSWLVWAIQVPRWRLWAYERVKNITLLKNAAIKGEFIWPENSIFQKTELASEHVWSKIKQLEELNKLNTQSHNASEPQLTDTLEEPTLHWGIRSLAIILLLSPLAYQNMHVFFSGENFDPKQHFENATKSKHFTFYSNNDVGYIPAFSNTFVEHIKANYFHPEFSAPLDFYILKDEGQMHRFISMELGIKVNTVWGTYIPERNALVTHEESGLGTFGHILMYPILGDKLRHAPYWTKSGIPTLFEKIYGYVIGNDLKIRYGYHNPWRIKKLGNISDINLSEIINEREAEHRNANKHKQQIVIMFIYQNGVFPRYLSLLTSNSKGDYKTFIEAAFEKEMPELKIIWKKYLANIERNKQQILETPPSQMFNSKKEFLEVTQRYEGL